MLQRRSRRENIHTGLFLLWQDHRRNQSRIWADQGTSCPVISGTLGSPGSLALSCNFIFSYRKETKKKEKWKEVAGGGMHGWLLFLGTLWWGIRKKNLLFFLIKRKGPKKPVQAWGGFCITCSCVGFHVIAKNELFRVVVAFCLLFVWCGLVFLSQVTMYLSSGGWGVEMWAGCLICLHQVCVCMCVFYKDLSGKRWTSLYLFWLTDKYYIVIGFFNILFLLWGGGMEIKA